MIILFYIWLRHKWRHLFDVKPRVTTVSARELCTVCGDSDPHCQWHVQRWL